jgi:hypothetical protein
MSALVSSLIAQKGRQQFLPQLSPKRKAAKICKQKVGRSSHSFSHGSHSSATAATTQPQHPLSLPLPLPLPLPLAAAATATVTATVSTANTAAFFWWSLTVCTFIIASFFTALIFFLKFSVFFPTLCTRLLCFSQSTYTFLKGVYLFSHSFSLF